MADISANLPGERLYLSAAFGRPTNASPLQVNPIPPAPAITAAGQFAAGLGAETTRAWWETSAISAAAIASAQLA